jgi:hypothetical protein
MAKEKIDVTLNKNARAGQRGATAALTPHICPVCHTRVPENQLVVAVEYKGGKRRQAKGYHRSCYGTES